MALRHHVDRESTWDWDRLSLYANESRRRTYVNGVHCASTTDHAVYTVVVKKFLVQ